MVRCEVAASNPPWVLEFCCTSIFSSGGSLAIGGREIIGKRDCGFRMALKTQKRPDLK